tara:strand:- start:1932 stop:2342 length:411 start_codon:yes stop_codon:yes gene_type:complete
VDTLRVDRVAFPARFDARRAVDAAFVAGAAEPLRANIIARARASTPIPSILRGVRDYREVNSRAVARSLGRVRSRRRGRARECADNDGARRSTNRMIRHIATPSTIARPSSRVALERDDRVVRLRASRARARTRRA